MVISRATHAAKGLAAASVATFVALFGHVAGGGSIPGSVGLVAALVLSGAVCVLIAGRRLSLLRLTLSVAVSQALFHFLFVLGTSSDQVLHAHHNQGAMAMSTAAGPHAATTMGLGHLAGAVVTIAVLYFGERIIRGLGDVVLLVASRMLRRASIPVASSPAPRVPYSAAWRVLLPRALDDAASIATRRGPPALAA